MSIYVDNHASTRCDDRVFAAMMPYFGVLSEGNPSSSYHTAGRAAASACQNGRKFVSELVGSVDVRVVFTGSATEANNLAIIGSCMAGRALRGTNHVVSTQIEHPSVLRALSYLQTQGFKISLVAPDELGRISVDEILGCVTDDTILISVMSANNEVGTLQPIEKIATGAPPSVLIHSDSCQSVGRLPTKMFEWGIDLLTIAGHKMHGPKGIGALCVSDRVILTPQILGNHQEHGLRAGTPNVPGIVGLGRACQIYLEEGREESAYVACLRNTFRDNLLASIPDVYINGDQDERLPGNLHVSFIGVPSDELMRAMPGVCVSSGAACTSGRGQPSHVVSAMNIPSSRAESSIRFGFGRFNTQREITTLTDMVVNAVRNIRSKTH